jgi:hypothetical protein
VPFQFEIQPPYDLKTGGRCDFDPAQNIRHFWILCPDKPHAPQPNRTTARTDIRLETFSAGEPMFDADVKVMKPCRTRKLNRAWPVPDEFIATFGKVRLVREADDRTSHRGCHCATCAKYVAPELLAISDTNIRTFKCRRLRSGT